MVRPRCPCYVVGLSSAWYGICKGLHTLHGVAETVGLLLGICILGVLLRGSGPLAV